MELHFKDVLSSMLMIDFQFVVRDRMGSQFFFPRIYVAVVAVIVEFSYTHAMHV